MATKKPTKKTVQPTLVTINPKWQLAFVVVMLATVLIPSALMIWNLMRIPHERMGVSMSFLIGQSLFPLLFIVVGYLYALVRVRGVLPRLFWAVFLGTIGMSVYYALQLPLSYLSNVFNLYSTGPNNNWWGSTGWIWTQMGVALGLYCVVLAILARRAKRS